VALIEEVSEFVYLGSRLSTRGGTEEDMNARLGKARGVFKAMEKVWRSKVLPRRTKVKLFNSNVKIIRDMETN